jgi:ubiquinone/menaquinone biosynthesis C-methylase UbiE
MKVKQRLTKWYRSSSATLRLFTYFKYRRVKEIDRLMHGKLFNPIENSKIIEIGCGKGLDFIQFFVHEESFTLYGLDLIDRGICYKNFNMIVGDAESIKFPDNYFHFLISIGVLEHIHPIEKLTNVIKEIDRVSQSYCIIVPSINTILEPHTQVIFWQLRNYYKKEQRDYKLNYFTDTNWLEFKGFNGAKIKRFNYIPFIVKNLIIYKYRNN